jgi:chromate transporter
MRSPSSQSAPADEIVRVSLAQFVGYFLRLGAIGFGGPIALAGYMQRDLVGQRRWISRENYLEGLALAQLAPGPLAAQLAIYLGYCRAGAFGATLVGFAFIAPSFLMVIGLAEAYVRFGGLPWMQGVFYGIGAAVIAIIAKSAFKLARLTLRNDKLLWAISVVMAVSTAYTEREIVWLLILGGVVALLIKNAPWRFPQIRQLPMLLMSAPILVGNGKVWELLLFFTKAGAFVFGSGLAIVPFLYGGVVQQHHWLTDRQFLDAVAVAMITPGPVVITAGFIGFLVAGVPGAVAAATGVFLPVYIVVLIVSPYFKRLVANPQLKAAVEGVTAAATGAIAGAVVVLGRRAIHDVPTTLIGFATLIVILRWKVPEPFVVLLAAILGVLIHSP